MGKVTEGEKTVSFQAEGAPHLLAVLAEAKPDEIERFRQQSQHPITHTITQRGSPKSQRRKTALCMAAAIFMSRAWIARETWASGLSTMPRKRSDVDGDQPG